MLPFALTAFAIEFEPPHQPLNAHNRNTVKVIGIIGLIQQRNVADNDGGPTGFCLCKCLTDGLAQIRPIDLIQGCHSAWLGKNNLGQLGAI